MKKFYILSFLLYSLVAACYAQTITGKVTDEFGQGLPGVNVVLKNTNVGTTTDASGIYNLNVNTASGILVYSFIGYKAQEIAIDSRTIIDVLMIPDVQALEEVVVIGYGEQRTITMTGAVNQVSGTEIRQNPSASLQNMLAGRLPGFTTQQRSGRPGRDGAEFFIRGQSSYNGNNQPLIIVDDIEFTYEQFARLDPNEIESISILKDASTTAIYGIKGANGVVVVTTRRGKIGAPRITFRTEASYSQPTLLPDFLDAYQTASLYNQAQINDNALNPSPTFTPRFTDEDLELFRNGQDPYGHPNIDWKDVLFKDFSSQYRGNMDISGGTEKVKYFVSLGYLWQDGILKDYSKNQDVRANYYHTRYNYRSNLDMTVTKDLDLRLDLYGNIGEVNNPSFGSAFGYNDIFYEYSSFLSLAPFAYPIYNPDGSFGYSQWQRNEVGSSYNRNNIVGRLTHYGYSRDFENNMNLVASARHKLNFITEGLSIKGTVSYASSHSYSRSMTRDQFPSFIYHPDTDTYEPRDANVYRVRRFFIGYNAGSTVRNVNLQAILDYDRTFGDHHVYGLALLNQYSKTNYVNNAVYNFVPNNFRGYSFRLGYDYKDKYLFQANMGYNGSDRFAKDKRFGFFPAVSVGWNIAEETFFTDNVSFMDRLKLRSSYGLVGNDKLGDAFAYYYEQTYSQGNGVGNLAGSFGYSNNAYSGVREGTLPNANVTWEKEKKFDVGLDMAFFNNRLSASFDYFNNERYDIMTTRGTVSAIFGQALPPVNLGRVNNKGYEIEISYKQTFQDDFSFSMKGSYSFAKNKILFQDEPTPQYDYQAYTGKSIGQIRVFEFIGFYKDQEDIDNSPKTSLPVRPGDLKYADINNDGFITDADMSVAGYSNFPNTVYGLQLGVNYKNIQLNVLFQGTRNFNVRGVAEAIQAFGSNLMDIHTKSWTPELGDNAEYPILTVNNPGISNPRSYPSTFWFVRGDYLRIKSAELSYTLPAIVSDKLKADNIRVYANGFNLFTWSSIFKRYEFDPEINSGTDRVNYPPQRMFNIGLSATF